MNTMLVEVKWVDIGNKCSRIAETFKNDNLISL